MSENSTAFHVQKGDQGLWYVTSPDHPGLLIAGDTMHNALLQVQKSIDEMASAKAAPPAWMVEVAREGVAQTNERRGGLADHGFARSVRAGSKDDHPEVKAAISALRLALERGHVVEAREALTESFVSEDDPLFNPIWDVIKGWDIGDPAKYGGYCGATGDHVRAIIRAVRAVVAPAAPSVDLEALANKAWRAGWDAASHALDTMQTGQGDATTLCMRQQSRDVSSLLSTLPTREA